MKYLLIAVAAASLGACVDTPTSQAQAEKPAIKTEVKPKPEQQATQAPKPAVKPGQITGVTIGQLFTLLQSDQVYLVDVRPPLYFRLGHIEGAVNFPLIKYDARLAEQLPLIKQAKASGKTVVLYCQNVNCPDAYKTAQKLVTHGLSVSIYKGGWEEWKKSGLQ